MSSYNVFLINPFPHDDDAKAAADKLAERFNMPADKALALAAKKRAQIKKDVAWGDAQNIAVAIRECGFQAEIVNTQDDDSSEATKAKPAPSPSSTARSSGNANSDAYRAPASSLSNAKANCRKCGGEIETYVKRCPHCNAHAIPSTGRSKVAAGFLAFFLGGFGIHRFYLGQWWGIFYLLLWVTGIPSLISLIEAIVFWASDQRAWDQRYGHLPPSSAAIIAAICILPFIALIGILAAIALPAYQDYTARAQVNEGYMEMRSWTWTIQDFAIDNNRMPNSAAEAGISESGLSPSLHSIELQEGGVIVGTFHSIGGDYAPTLMLYPEIDRSGGEIAYVEWECKGGSMSMKHRPRECRNEFSEGSSLTPTPSTDHKIIVSSISSASVEVPKNWREGVAENDEASINAGNLFAETYMLLIEESKYETDINSLDQYLATLDGIYSSSVERYSHVNSGQFRSYNGLSGQFTQFKGLSDGYDIEFLVGAYMTDEKFYQVFTWTTQSSMPTHQEKLWRVIKSFEANE